LTEPEIDVASFDHGHVLAMIAVGLLGAAAYYRAPYDGGAAFLLIPELPQLRGVAKTSDLDITLDSRTSKRRGIRRSTRSSIRRDGW
jgi:hypothetical protein